MKSSEEESLEESDDEVSDDDEDEEDELPELGDVDGARRDFRDFLRLEDGPSLSLSVSVSRPRCDFDFDFPCCVFLCELDR